MHGKNIWPKDVIKKNSLSKYKKLFKNNRKYKNSGKSLLLAATLFMILVIIKLIVDPPVSLIDFFLFTISCFLFTIYFVSGNSVISATCSVYFLCIWIFITYMALRYQNLAVAACFGYLILVLITVRISSLRYSVFIGVLSLISISVIYSDIAFLQKPDTAHTKSVLDFTYSMCVIYGLILVFISVNKKSSGYFIGKISDEQEKRKAINNKLIDSELKTAAVFDLLYGFMGLLSPDGRLLEVNRYALDFSGVNSNDVINMKFWESPWCSHSKAVADLFKTGVKHASDGELFRDRTTHISSDGKIAIVEFTLLPVLDNKREIRYILAQGVDITNMMRAEETIKSLGGRFLHMSDVELYESVAEYIAEVTSLDCIYIGELNESGDKIRVVGEFGRNMNMKGVEYDLAGTPCNEVICEGICSYPSFFRSYFPDNVVFNRLGVEGYVAILLSDNSGKPLGIMAGLSRRPVKNFDMAIDLFKVFVDRLSAEMQRSHIHTMLLESDKRLKDIIYSIGDWVWEIDRYGRFVYSSEQCHRILGIPAGEIVGSLLFDYICEEDNNCVKIDFERLLIGVNRFKDYEIRIKQPRGNIIILLTSGVPFFDVNGNVEGFRAVSKDITLQKEQDLILKDTWYRKLSEQKVITEIAMSSAQNNSELYQLFRKITQMGSEAVKADRVSVWLINEERELTCVCAYDELSKCFSADGVLIEEEYKDEFEILDKVKFIAAYDAWNDSRIMGVMEGYFKYYGLVSILHVVIRKSNLSIGIISFGYSGNKHVWKDDEITFASQLADKISLSIGECERGMDRLKLEESEKKFRDLVESINEIFFTIDINGIITYISPQVKNICDYEPEDLIGERIEKLFHKNDKDMVHGIFTDVLKGDIKTLEYRIVGKYGNIIYITSSFVLIEKEGIANGLKGSMIDVTEKRNAEKKITMLAQSVTSIKEAVCVIDLDKNILFVNNSYARLFEYSEEEILGKSISFIKSGDYLEKFHNEIIRKTLINGGWKGELVNISKSGREILTQLSTSILNDETGNPYAIIGIIMDISEDRKIARELKISEDRLSRAETVSKTGNFEYNINTGLVQLSNGAASVLGFEALEIKVISFLKIVRFDCFNIIRRIYSEIVKNSKLINFELKVKKADTGQEISLQVYAQNISSDSVVFGAIQDISIKTEYEEQLKRKNKDLNFLNDFATGLINSNMSQEMIQLLINNLIGYLGAEVVTFSSYNHYEKALYLHECQVLHDDNILKNYRRTHVPVRDKIYDDLVSNSFYTSNSVKDISFGFISDDLTDYFEKVLSTNYYIRFSLTIHGNLLGVLFLAFREISSVTDHDLIISLGHLSTTTFGRITSEEALRMSEKKHMSMISNISDVIAIIDTKNIIRYESPNLLKLRGFAPEEVVGLSALDFVHPDDFKVMKKLFSDILLEKGITKYAECRYKCKDGSYKWMRNAAINRVNDPSIQGYLINYHDITQQKESEIEINKFRLGIERSPEAIFITNISGEINYVNDSFNRIYGYEPDEVTGKTPRILKSGQYSNQMYSSFWNTLLSKESIEGEIINRKKDGSFAIIDSVNSPIIDSSGQIIGFLGIHRDITKRKEDEKELRASEEKFRKAFMTSPDAIAISSYKDGVISVVNKGFLVASGYTEKEVLGKTTAQLELWDNKNQRVEILEELNEKGIVQNMEVGFVTKERNIQAGLLSASVITLNDEPHVLFMVRNIDEIIKTQRALAESEERFQQVAEIAGEWIWEVDSSGRFTYSSPVVGKLLDYTVDDIVGRSCLFDFSVGNRKMRIKREILGFFRKKADIIKYHYINVRQDGRLVTLEMSGKPVLNDKGKLLGYRGTAIDITERLQFIEKLRKLSTAVEQSPVSIIITDINGSIEYTNKRFSELTGYSGDEVKGQNSRIFNSGKTKPEVYQNMWNTIINGKEWNGELLNKKKNGELFWEGIMISPVIDDKGNITNFLAIKEDLTEKKERTRQIFDTIIETEERERLRYSHELHDGIGPILSTFNIYSQMLAENDDEKQKAIIVSKTKNCINEAIQTIKEISFNLSPSVLSNFGIVSGIQNFINRINDTGKLAIYFDSDINMRFEKNVEITIYRIITELINNTLKYSKASTARIGIEFIENDSRIFLYYEDNGCGFNYEKVLKSRKGLGLSNINQRISTLNGRVEVNTSRGHGMRMEVDLPVKAI